MRNGSGGCLFPSSPTAHTAFDHARILSDALAAVDDEAWAKRFDSVIAAADRRNQQLLIAVRSRMLAEQAPDESVLLAEYEAMKHETVERIKQRDSFINLNIVAAALIVGFAGSSQGRVAAWLALPWSSLCFGWAYLANDEKVSGLSKYFEYTMAPQLGPRALAWERSAKRSTSLKRTHKTVQLLADLLQFVAPTIAGIIAYGSIAVHPWRPWMLTLVVAEGFLALCLGGLFIAHSHFVKRWNIRKEEWEAF
jgi:thiamine transporter ThiT